MRREAMRETDKLRVLLPHWIEHNSEHAEEFREWSQKAGPARDALLDAARLLKQANTQLQEALRQLGGPLEYGHG
jgi:FtsZ-binding cell division protein ZapB